MSHANQPDATQRYAQGRGVALLWFGVLAGPVAWLLDLTARYALVQSVCPQEAHAAVHVIMTGALILATAGIWVSVQNWRRIGLHWPGEEEGVVGRTRFLAAAGVLTGAFSILYIIAQSIPTFVLEPCL